MSYTCKVCEERIDQKKSEMISGFKFGYTKYCSMKCQIANARHIFLSIGFVLITIYLAVGLSLFFTRGLWLLLVVMIPFAFLGLILFIAGFTSLGLYISAKRKHSSRRFYCYYCTSDITESSKRGSLLCNNCGNKVLYCNLCSKIINPQEEIATTKPCGHTFHKNELMDYSEGSKICPKCHKNVEEISFQLSKEDVFWKEKI